MGKSSSLTSQAPGGYAQMRLNLLRLWGIVGHREGGAADCWPPATLPHGTAGGGGRRGATAGHDTLPVRCRRHAAGSSAAAAAPAAGRGCSRRGRLCGRCGVSLDAASGRGREGSCRRSSDCENVAARVQYLSADHIESQVRKGAAQVPAREGRSRSVEAGARLKGDDGYVLETGQRLSCPRCDRLRQWLAAHSQVLRMARAGKRRGSPGVASHDASHRL